MVIDVENSNLSFNRTFMELKYFPMITKYSKEWGFNRTFMELKYSIGSPVIDIGRVLIVPLWN